MMYNYLNLVDFRAEDGTWIEICKVLDASFIEWHKDSFKRGKLKLSIRDPAQQQFSYYINISENMERKTQAHLKEEKKKLCMFIIKVRLVNYFLLKRNHVTKSHYKILNQVITVFTFISQKYTWPKGMQELHFNVGCFTEVRK